MSDESVNRKREDSDLDKSYLQDGYLQILPFEIDLYLRQSSTSSAVPGQLISFTYSFQSQKHTLTLPFMGGGAWVVLCPPSSPSAT